MSPPGHQSEKNPAGDSKEPCGTENGRMTMNRSTFHTIGAVAATAVMLASCAKNEVISRRPSLDPDAIAFNVSSGFVPADMPESKSGGQAEEKPAVLLGDNGDTLYLHPSVVPNDRGLTALPETRDVPIRNAGGINSFFVTAKINDGGGSEDDVLYIDDEEVKRVAEGGSIWTTSEGQHFWPDGQTTLDFYAYSNLTFSDGSEGSTAPAGNLKMEDGTLSFSYTVPGGTTAGTGTPASADAAKQQPDILFALASASRSQTTDGDGTVDLNFEHALAGVQFRAKNIAGGTIQRITLKNIYGQGDCTYTLSDETTDSGARKGTFDWSNLGGEGKAKMDFVQKMEVVVKESSTQPEGTLQDVTTEANNEMTFMMIPQSTEGVEVEIVLEGNLDKKTYTVSGRLSGPDASSPIEWEAGNIYIYDISTDSINWTYVFEVTPTVTLEFGQTSAPYTVTSYRYRTQNPSEIQAVPWTSENIGATETDAENHGTFDVDVNDVLSEFTYSGEGTENINGVDYTLKLSTPTMHTTYPGDITLKNAAGKGTEENPYDLSTHDEKGGTINETTANCYVVDAPGVYKLPLVYGNALLDGQNNQDAYKGEAFVDYNGNKINQPYIDNPHDCCLVWSDGYYMVKDVKLSDDEKYLVFTIDEDYLQQANAVVAVRDSEGKIMWSWHIWVTERKIYSENIHELHDIFGSSRIYYMMQCNLGWVDGKTVYYNDRELNFRFTQSASGNVREMKVSHNGDIFDYKDPGSTYYQWGRKDPLVALRNWHNVGFNDYRLHEIGKDGYQYRYEYAPVEQNIAIQNPNVFYARPAGKDVDWLDGSNPTLWDAEGSNGVLQKETSVKTVYDPSPRGFKVPVARAFAVLVNGYTGDGNLDNLQPGQNPIEITGVLNGESWEDVPNNPNKNQYIAYPQPNKHGTGIPLTATGQRSDRDGLLEKYDQNGSEKADIGGLWAMYGVYYQSCVPSNNTMSYCLVIRRDYQSGVEVYSYGFQGAKSMARPVRCIKDI